MQRWGPMHFAAAADATNELPNVAASAAAADLALHSIAAERGVTRQFFFLPARRSPHAKVTRKSSVTGEAAI